MDNLARNIGYSYATRIPESTYPVAVAVSSTSSVTVTPTVIASRTATVTGTGTATATRTFLTGAIERTASISATGSVTVATTVIRRGVVASDATATVTATTTIVRRVSVAIGASATVTASNALAPVIRPTTGLVWESLGGHSDNYEALRNNLTGYWGVDVEFDNNVQILTYKQHCFNFISPPATEKFIQCRVYRLDGLEDLIAGPVALSSTVGTDSFGQGDWVQWDFAGELLTAGTRYAVLICYDDDSYVDTNQYWYMDKSAPFFSVEAITSHGFATWNAHPGSWGVKEVSNAGWFPDSELEGVIPLSISATASVVVVPTIIRNRSVSVVATAGMDVGYAYTFARSSAITGQATADVTYVMDRTVQASMAATCSVFVFGIITRTASMVATAILDISRLPLRVRPVTLVGTATVDASERYIHGYGIIELQAEGTLTMAGTKVHGGLASFTGTCTLVVEDPSFLYSFMEQHYLLVATFSAIGGKITPVSATTNSTGTVAANGLRYGPASAGFTGEATFSADGTYYPSQSGALFSVNRRDVMELGRQKGVAATISIPMLDSSSPETFATGLTVADEAYYNDGAGWQALAITDDFTEIGTTGEYSIDLTGAEMDHDIISIKCTSVGAADTSLKIYTGDHLSVRNMVIEQNNGITLQQAVSLILAMTTGVSSNSGLTFQDPSGSSIRIEATVDDDSNRTSIITTPST